MGFDLDLSLYVLLARKDSPLTGDFWNSLLSADTAVQFAQQGKKERQVNGKAEQLLLAASEWLSSHASN